jgi:hypothetical protein
MAPCRGWLFWFNTTPEIKGSEEDAEKNARRIKKEKKILV